MKKWLLSMLAFWLAFPVLADLAPGQVGYYVGVDGLGTLASGTYVGKPNPNKGRLTLLFNHGDHFHGIGQFAYAGPVDAPTIEPTNANNHIPEISSLQPPLPLTPGEGALYAGKLVNKASDAEYSHIEFGNIRRLSTAKPDSASGILFNSSGGRWTTEFASASIAIQLVSKTPGLHIGTDASADVLEFPGDYFHMGRGASRNIRFSPVFWTDAAAPSGTYSVEFRLIDLNRDPTSRVPASGSFHFDFAVP